MTEADWHTSWVEALDRLELDVEHAEQMLRVNDPEPMPAWEPPVMHMSMPEDLVPRARLILERQLAVTNDITRAMVSTQQQRAFTSKVSANIPADVPVYLDITA
jgi:hypothetical protein